MTITHCEKHDTYRDAEKEPCWACVRELQQQFLAGKIPLEEMPNSVDPAHTPLFQSRDNDLPTP